MKTFLRIVGVVVTLFVAITLFGFLLPREIRIQRSILVEAPPEAVYPLVADLKRWPDWQAWNKEMDPTVTYTFSDPSVGEGAWYEWKGEKLSTGKVAVTGVAPGRSVDYTVDFAGSGANPGTMFFEETGEPSQTNVTWDFYCDMGFSPVGRYMGLIMKGMLEKDFDTGLANLKRLAETEANDATAPRGKATPAAASAEEAEEEAAAPGDDPSATEPASGDAEPETTSAPGVATSDEAASMPAAADASEEAAVEARE